MPRDRRVTNAFAHMAVTRTSETLLTADGRYAGAGRKSQQMTTGTVANGVVAGGFAFGDLPSCDGAFTLAMRCQAAALRWRWLLRPMFPLDLDNEWQRPDRASMDRN